MRKRGNRRETSIMEDLILNKAEIIEFDAKTPACDLDGGYCSYRRQNILRSYIEKYCGGIVKNEKRKNYN